MPCASGGDRGLSGPQTVVGVALLRTHPCVDACDARQDSARRHPASPHRALPRNFAACSFVTRRSSVSSTFEQSSGAHLTGGRPFSAISGERTSTGERRGTSEVVVIPQ